MGSHCTSTTGQATMNVSRHLLLRRVMATQPWRQALLIGLLLTGPGAWLGLWPWQAEMGALEHLREEVTQLEGKLEQTAVSAVTAQRPPVYPDGAGRPQASDSQAVWSWLQQRLQAHGLRIQGLRPGPLEQGAGLPEQGVVLEVLGSWADWLAFEQALDRHAPWWTLTQWQMAPGPMPGQVRVRWDARWAWRPHASVDGSAVSLPVWRPAEPLHAAAPVFEAPGHASGTASAVRPAASEAGETTGAADPTWRLLGIWHQQGVPHAVLERGQEQFVMSPGQRHERHGHRLLRVGPAEAVLQPPQADAAPLRLVLKGGPQ